MNRGIWLLVCLVIGFGSAFLLNANSGGLTNLLSSALEMTGTTASASDTLGDLANIAVGLAAGGLIAAALFILPLALVDGYATYNANAVLTAQLSENQKKHKSTTRSELLGVLSGSDPLECAADVYISSLILTSKTPNPPANTGITGSNLSAASIFTTSALVDRALYLWFFRGFAFSLAGLGTTSALVILANETLSVASLPFAANAASAVMILILCGLPGNLRHQQVERLQDSLDGLFPSDPWGGQFDEINATASDGLEETAEAVRKARAEIVKAINAAARSTTTAVDGSLEKWRGDLTIAVEKSLKGPMTALASDQGKGIEKLVSATLKSVKSGLQDPMVKQVASLEKSVKSTSRIVAQTQKAFDKAIADLSRKLADHEKELSKDFAGYTGDLKKSMGGQVQAAGRIDELSTAIAASLDSMKPLLNRIAGGQEELAAVIQDEGTAAQLISASSKELSSAAKASRESVEQFVALAENLKAVSIALQKAGANAGSAASVSGSDENNTKDSNTRPAELSQAIRDLKKSSGKRTLPKL